MNNSIFVSLEKPFSVTGLYTRTNNYNEFNPKTAKIGDLWSEFSQNYLKKQIDQNLTHTYGVYSQYESDHEGDYTLTAGVNSDSSIEESSDFHEVIIQPGQYMLFEANGEQPESIINTWQYIWKYFSDDSAPKRKFTTDFEKYISDSKVEIYIAVEN